MLTRLSGTRSSSNCNDNTLECKITNFNFNRMKLNDIEKAAAIRQLHLNDEVAVKDLQLLQKRMKEKHNLVMKELVFKLYFFPPNFSYHISNKLIFEEFFLASSPRERQYKTKFLKLALYYHEKSPNQIENMTLGKYIFLISYCNFS